MSDEDFVEFIEDVLIPDLIDSGSTATAEDFTRLVEIIHKLTNKGE